MSGGDFLSRSEQARLTRRRIEDRVTVIRDLAAIIERQGEQGAAMQLDVMPTDLPRWLGRKAELSDALLLAMYGPGGNRLQPGLAAPLNDFEAKRAALEQAAEVRAASAADAKRRAALAREGIRIVQRQDPASVREAEALATLGTNRSELLTMLDKAKLRHGYSIKDLAAALNEGSAVLARVMIGSVKFDAQLGRKVLAMRQPAAAATSEPAARDEEAPALPEPAPLTPVEEPPIDAVMRRAAKAPWIAREAALLTSLGTTRVIVSQLALDLRAEHDNWEQAGAVLGFKASTFMRCVKAYDPLTANCVAKLLAWAAAKGDTNAGEVAGDTTPAPAQEAVRQTPPATDTADALPPVASVETGEAVRADPVVEAVVDTPAVAASPEIQTGYAALAGNLAAALAAEREALTVRECEIRDERSRLIIRDLDLSAERDAILPKLAEIDTALAGLKPLVAA